jgi:magnesium transporter
MILTRPYRNLRRALTRRSKTVGQAPGQSMHIEDHKLEPTRIRAFVYDADNMIETEVQQADDIERVLSQSGIKWIHVDGLQNAPLLQEIGEKLGLHSLILEDVLNTDQRTKCEDYGQAIYIVLKWFEIEGENEEISEEQISIILQKDVVLSVTEKQADEFAVVRDYIRSGKRRRFLLNADYLAYRLVDSVVDHYFSILEHIGERIDALEVTLIESPSPQILPSLLTIKHELLFLRKAVWPLREMLSALQREETPLIRPETLMYFRDVYDHTIQVMDTIETFRDTQASKFDMYLSSLSFRQNEVMKVLTIIATIFLPLTFLAGIWGMNFEHMPELRWPQGYAIALGIMLVIGGAMVAYFRKKKWL